MTTYFVDMEAAPGGHQTPALLVDVAAFISTQTRGSLGWFDAVRLEPIPVQWAPDNTERLNAAGFSFLHLPDGSQLALLAGAVVLLGSEGEAKTIGDSLEDFLLRWSRRATGIFDLDDPDPDHEQADGRPDLGAWLAASAIQAPAGWAPAAPAFDFVAWLDGQPDAAAPPSTAVDREPTPLVRRLGPRLRELVALVGRRVDDPVLVGYLGDVLGQQPPQHTSTRDDMAGLSAPGLSFTFSHNVVHERYPPVARTKNSYLPYLRSVDLDLHGDNAFTEPVLAIPRDADEDAVTALLGPPHGRRGVHRAADPTIAYWRYPVDTAAAVDLLIEVRRRLVIRLVVDSAAVLDATLRPGTQLFIAWAVGRDLFAETRLGNHAGLVAAVRERRLPASELARTALPRGLWDVHLRDLPGLRETAYRYFYGVKSPDITTELCGLFGARKNAFQHNEPVLDDDSWDAVDRATPLFDERFTAWAGR